MDAFIQPLLCGYVVFYISLHKGLYMYIYYSSNQNILVVKKFHQVKVWIYKN
jgi:hypothetical protein